MHTRSCEMVASYLGDRYHNGRLRIRGSSPYIDTVNKEKIPLVAFGTDEVLAGIFRYIKEKKSPEIMRTVALREKLASDQNSGWDSVPDLQRSCLKINQLKVRYVNDLIMVFAPVSDEEFARIQVFIGRDMKLYDPKSYLVLYKPDLPKVMDFQYLHPVTTEKVGNFMVISTDRMTYEQLHLLYFYDEKKFTFHALDTLRGCFATHLLAESLEYNFLTWWDDRSLYVGLAGSIQTQDIVENFQRILVEVNKSIVEIRKVKDYKEAVNYCRTTNCKAFQYLGDYFIAIGDKNVEVETNILETDEVIEPLRAVVDEEQREKALLYFKSLGYDTKLSTDETSWWPTIESEDITEGGIRRKREYYISTHGQKVEFDGKFTLRDRNLLKGYPGFVPS